MKKEIPYGYCQCGCGERAPLQKRSNKKLNQKIGDPCKFVFGHNLNILDRCGENHPRWTDNPLQYRTWERKKDGKRIRMFEHVRIAEGVLGRKLKIDECVHHFDEDILNNSNSNLVICENNAYHKFLH